NPRRRLSPRRPHCHLLPRYRRPPKRRANRSSPHPPTREATSNVRGIGLASKPPTRGSILSLCGRAVIRNARGLQERPVLDGIAHTGGGLTNLDAAGRERQRRVHVLEAVIEENWLTSIALAVPVGVDVRDLRLVDRRHYLREKDVERA